jgi:hypothetical protein
MGRHPNNQNQNAAPFDGDGMNEDTNPAEPSRTATSAPGADQGAGADGASPAGGPQDGGKPPESGTLDTKPPESGTRLVRNPGRKGTKLTVGAKTIEFDAEGIVELDAERADILLSIPGYEEVKQE